MENCVQLWNSWKIVFNCLSNHTIEKIVCKNKLNEDTLREDNMNSRDEYARNRYRGSDKSF